MNMDIVWSAMLLGWLALFAIFEGYALLTGNETLSAFVRGMGTNYPFVPYVYIVTVLGLAVHFWWQFHKG